MSANLLHSVAPEKGRESAFPERGDNSWIKRIGLPFACRDRAWVVYGSRLSAPEGQHRYLIFDVATGRSVGQIVAPNAATARVVATSLIAFTPELVWNEMLCSPSRHRARSEPKARIGMTADTRPRLFAPVGARSDRPPARRLSRP